MPSASKCGRLQQTYVEGLLCSSAGSVVSTQQFLFRDDEDLRNDP